MNRQTGASSIVMIIMVVLAVSGLIMVLKLLPLYSQDWAVETVLENLKEEAKAKEFTSEQIESKLRKRFDINDISELAEFAIVEGASSQITIDMEYERRVGLFSNIELVATFKHYVDLSE
jgi:hypothetical protein